MVILVPLYLTQNIALPLRKVSSVAEQIAYGDLTAKVPSTSRKDEVGTLTLTIGMMAESLRMVTKKVQTIANNLSSTSSEMLENIKHENLQKEDIVAQIKFRTEKLDSL